MKEAIYLSQDPVACKNTVRRVGVKIDDAAKCIKKATTELNSANKSDLSYELNQLEAMYKESKQYASELETFSSTIEKMVSDYIDVDNSCAKKIKSNGKLYRKSVGLPKNIMIATIGATYERLEDKANDIIDWVDDILENCPVWNDIEEAVSYINECISNIPVIGYIHENFGEIASIAGNIIQIGAGVAVIVGSSGGIIPVLAGISIVMGIDKIAGTALYNGESSPIKELIPECVPDEVVNFVYDGVDIVSAFGSTNVTSNLSVLDKVNKLDNVYEKLKLVKQYNRFNSLVDKPQKILNTMKMINYGINVIGNDGDRKVKKVSEDMYKDICKDIYTDTYEGVFGPSSIQAKAYFRYMIKSKNGLLGNI